MATASEAVGSEKSVCERSDRVSSSDRVTRGVKTRNEVQREARGQKGKGTVSEAVAGVTASVWCADGREIPFQTRDPFLEVLARLVRYHCRQRQSRQLPC